MRVGCTNLVHDRHDVDCWLRFHPFHRSAPNMMHNDKGFAENCLNFSRLRFKQGRPCRVIFRYNNMAFHDVVSGRPFNADLSFV